MRINTVKDTDYDRDLDSKDSDDVNPAKALQGRPNVGAPPTARASPDKTLEERLSNLRGITLESLVTLLEGLRRDPLDPDLSSGTTGVRYVRFEGELYGSDGPSAYDIQQGRLGDCYFLAAISSVAREHPEQIKNMIRDEGNGIYSVRFYDKKTDGTFREVWVRVDAEFPADANRDAFYAKMVDQDGDGNVEYWVALVEKAYAAFGDQYGTTMKEGYDDINDGGEPDRALESILGVSAKAYSNIRSEDALEQLLAPVEDGAAVVVGTGVKVGPGWASDHAYSVLGTYEQDGVRLVVMRNPWGHTEPKASFDVIGENDGSFVVTLEELRKNIDWVYLAEPPKPVGGPAADWLAQVQRVRSGL